MVCGCEAPSASRSCTAKAAKDCTPEPLLGDVCNTYRPVSLPVCFASAPRAVRSLTPEGPPSQRGPWTAVVLPNSDARPSDYARPAAADRRSKSRPDDWSHARQCCAPSLPVPDDLGGCSATALDSPREAISADSILVRPSAWTDRAGPPQDGRPCGSSARRASRSSEACRFSELVARAQAKRLSSVRSDQSYVWVTMVVVSPVGSSSQRHR